jgi:hypothetical protein
MRIERESGEDVGSVWTVFSVGEARELLDALTMYFAESEGEPGWHCHLGEGESELVVEIEPPD